MKYSSIKKRLTKLKKIKEIQEQRLFIFYDQDEYKQWDGSVETNDNDLVIVCDYV